MAGTKPRKGVATAAAAWTAAGLLAISLSMQPAWAVPPAPAEAAAAAPPPMVIAAPREAAKAPPKPEARPAREVELAALPPAGRSLPSERAATVSEPGVTAPLPVPKPHLPKAAEKVEKPRSDRPAGSAAPSGKPATLEDMAVATAERYGLDPDLIHAVILTESLYNPEALSHKGAMGLMQLIPPTAKRYGVKDPWNPGQNMAGGARYLRDLLRRFGDLELALAAYNAGEEAVERYGRAVPPYAETQGYVVKAQAFLAKLKSGDSVADLKRRGAGVGGSRLSGWGVILGSYYGHGEAQRAVSQALGLVTKGRPAVVKRKHESGREYNALIVGLAEQSAGEACQRLRGSGAYCLALTPTQLRDGNAIWR